MKEFLSEREREAVDQIAAPTCTLDTLVSQLETVAEAMGLLITSSRFPDVPGCPYIVGTGGDFEEFAVPFIRNLNRDAGYGVGCLWPYRSRTLAAGEAPLIYFNREYMEKSVRVFDRLLICQSIIFDPEPTSAVIERAQELLPGLETYVISAAARIGALDTLEEDLPNIKFIPATVWQDTWASRDEISYWTISEALDTRPVKIVAKSARLLERLDASDDTRLADDWEGKPKAGLEL